MRRGLRGIPGCSEDVMVARDILLAEVTGAHYHVAHISSKHSVEMVRFAKSRGLNVTSEVTPHHIALADRDIPPYDSNYKMKPPLRSCGDVDAMIEGVVNGAIDAIATDHAPHPGDEKMQEFEKCPFGILGLETAIGLSLEQLVHSGKISVAKMVELFTTGSRSHPEAESRDAGAARSWRRDDLLDGSELDLRRDQERVAEQQHTVPRPHVQGRPGRDDCAWRNRLANQLGKIARRGFQLRRREFVNRGAMRMRNDQAGVFEPKVALLLSNGKGHLVSA